MPVSQALPFVTDFDHVGDADATMAAARERRNASISSAHNRSPH